MKVSPCFWLDFISFICWKRSLSTTSRSRLPCNFIFRIGFGKCPTWNKNLSGPIAYCWPALSWRLNNHHHLLWEKFPVERNYWERLRFVGRVFCESYFLFFRMKLCANGRRDRRQGYGKVVRVGMMPWLNDDRVPNSEGQLLSQLLFGVV